MSNLHKEYAVPTSFTAGGHTFKILLGKDIDTDGAIGITKFLQCEIRLRTHLDGEALSVSQVQQTYFHEKAHVMMMILNQDELNSNEPFIDNLGQIDFQISRTEKY